MASPQAILRAARAVPGGARPTPAPQGSELGQYFGRISPLAAELANERGYANAYAPFLPRPPRTFTEGAFGPMSPILPVPVDVPPPGGELPDARLFQGLVGYNLPSQPGSDGYKLASFSTLQTIADVYSVARTCIQRRKDEIAGLDWDIVPTKEASKAYQGDHKAMRDFGERRAAAIKFLRQPDPDFFSFGGFLKAALEQIFVFDALSLLLKPKRGRGLRKGILGSDLDCFNLVDGQTLRPLYGLHGEVPRPPAPYIQQYLFGVPRSDFPTLLTGKDIDDAGMRGYEAGAFAADQMLYLPINPRRHTPYGFGPTEQALIVIMTGLQKQAYQLDYYRQGTVPAVYISPGSQDITPNQVAELQAALNGFAGDPAWHHKIIVLPPGSKVEPQRAQDLADQFDEIIMTEVAMVFDVDPMSLGIIPKVSTVASPFAAREMAQASRTVHERTSTKPLLKFWCDIFNTILHRVCGQDDMRFTFAGMDEAQDQAAMTDLLVKQVQNGFISIDEAREELQRTAWGLDETSGPLVFTQMGPVPLNQMVEMLRQMQPLQSGQNAPANSAGTGDTRPRGVHHPPSSRPVGTHNPRLGLPSGSGMRTGLPSGGGGSVSDTPAHTAAVAHQSSGRSPSKAVRSELDALARHLRKGRDIATWMPRYLSGVAMAMVSEDLTKGIGIDEAVRGAAAIALPRQAYEWADDVIKASSGQWPGWQKDRQLQQQYRQRIRAAFTQAARQAKTMVRQWLTGALAVTAMQLARMILAVLAKLLGAVLASLWREAWHMGRQAAHAVLAGDEADWGGWEPGSPSAAADLDGLGEWIASHGRDALEGIEDTRAEELAAYLAEHGHGTADIDVIIAGIAEVLDADNRADMMAETELERAQGAASEQVFRQAGCAEKGWFIADENACARCKRNAAQGFIGFNDAFEDGSYWTPGHVRCRCGCIGRLAPGASKLARGRSVELNGQEYWPAGSYPHGPAMGGGGPMHAAHGPDGTQEYIPGGVPGMTAGGEPPRWPGSEAPAVVQDYEPGTGRAGGSRGGGTVLAPYRDRSDETHASYPDDADDADWPEHRGIPPRPGTYWPAPYMDGYWPRGGIGTEQSPATSIGGTDRGRPPNAVGKGASDYGDPNPVDPEHVLSVMRSNFPESALGWVKRSTWIGPVNIPWDRIDDDDIDSWAASHQPDAVNRFARDIAAGRGHLNPSVLVQRPGSDKAFIADGHHRALARRKLGKPVLAYVGFVKPGDVQAAEETHSAQVHSGTDPANKGAKADPPVAAGIAVRAADSGRILLLQRAASDDDPAGGFWECPGGRLDEGESAFEAARREFEEETGIKLPEGDLSGVWNSSNGRYRGFVLTVPSEDALPVFGDRDAVTNPDDPDRDAIEALAWWHPSQLKDNPAVRPELLEDVKRVRRALKSAETPYLSTHPAPIGHEGVWHSKHPPLELPPYIQNIRNALMRAGHSEQEAHAMAVAAIERWRRGDLEWGRGHVSPEVRAAAQEAYEQWMQLRAHHP